MHSSIGAEVAADFSQFYLSVGEHGRVYIPWGSTLGLVRENDIGQVLLTTVWQFVVIDGEIGSQQFRDDPQAPPIERYLIQFWPRPSSTPVVLKNESPWSGLSLNASPRSSQRSDLRAADPAG